MSEPVDAPRWPGESAEYRTARDELARAEHELVQAVEAVAAQRRALPPGRKVQDYEFVEGPLDIGEDGPARKVRMSDLFGPHETLMLYSFMFDGSADACPMCTSLIDGYEGAMADLDERVGFAVLAPAPLDQLRGYGRSRGWRNVRLVSSVGSEYNTAYGAVTADGGLESTMNVFSRRDGSIRHFWGAEKLATPAGQDDRHLDFLWTLWGALDLTPEGRGESWRPSRPARR
jgi:predicted dithiol-disulfide oxidoreductase (DUF899 family)